MRERVRDINYVVFILLFYLLLSQAPLSNVISVFSYVDELIAIIAIPFAILQLKRNKFRISKKKNSFLSLLIIFSIAGIWGSVRYNYQPIGSVAIPDLFLCVKFWLAIYTGKILFSKMNLQRNGRGIFFHVKIVTILFCALAVIDNIAHIYTANIRYGIRSTHLFYDSPTAFAAACAFLIAVLTIVHPYVIRTRKWFVILLILMCSSLRSKAFAAAVAFILIYYFVFYRKKQLTFKTLLLFVPLILFMVGDQIEYYFFSDIQSDSARYQLLMASISIAKDSFPIGTGFGTFGSYMSAIYYSPVYRIYGISNVHGLIEGATYFTSDSFWPMILGETGIVGLISIVLVIIRMIKRLQKIKNLDLSLYASGLVCISYMLIISMAESAFVNPVAIPLAIVLGLVYGKGENILQVD